MTEKEIVELKIQAFNLALKVPDNQGDIASYNAYRQTLTAKKNTKSVLEDAITIHNWLMDRCTTNNGIAKPSYTGGVFLF